MIFVTILCLIIVASCIGAGAIFIIETYVEALRRMEK